MFRKSKDEQISMLDRYLTANKQTRDAVDRQKNIELVATSLTGELPNNIVADLKLVDVKRSVLKCPEGKVPVSNKYNEKSTYITAVMSGYCYVSCPNWEECKANVNDKKNKCSVKLYVNSVRRAKKARDLGTDKMKKAARRRNRGEGVLSVLRRKYILNDILFWDQCIRDLGMDLAVGVQSGQVHKIHDIKQATKKSKINL